LGRGLAIVEVGLAHLVGMAKAEFLINICREERLKQNGFESR